jgi:hypothetical protein
LGRALYRFFSDKYLMTKTRLIYLFIALALFVGFGYAGRKVKTSVSSAAAVPAMMAEEFPLEPEEFEAPAPRLKSSLKSDTAASFSPEKLRKLVGFFAKPYSANHAIFQAQVVNRLQTLKSLAHRDGLAVFYKNILANPQEHWLVKRQVFKNLKASLSPAEREAYYTQLDSRVVALASLSEKEILEEVLGEQKKPL